MNEIENIKDLFDEFIETADEFIKKVKKEETKWKVNKKRFNG